jgi:yeast amino acid transporter
MEEKFGDRDAATSSSGSPPPAPYERESTAARGSLKARIWDSFKRDPNATVTRADAVGADGADGKVFDVEVAAQATADSPLSKRLRSRHLQMIAIGGSVGTGPSNYLGRIRF